MNSPMSPQTNLSSELRRIINDRNMLSMRSRMKVLTAMNESHQRCAAERQKSLRAQAIQEVLTTEVTYLRQLEILMEFFIQPILERKLLKHMLLSTLAENIKTLYNVSGELVQELKHDPENIAKAFYKLGPFFKLYSVYAYDYEQLLELLQNAQESDTAFRIFINNQETRPEVSKKLSALLITPIQRVPRYILLLKEVLQHTPTKHKEYSLLQACLVELEKSATHINAFVAQNEDTRKLLTLQKCIQNKINLVKPGRKLIKQGPLMRVSRRSNTAYRRYFVLLSDTLLYCKGDPENSLTVCCVLPLNKCKVECVLTGGLFRVTCLEETLLLYAEKDDSNSWIQAMQSAISKYTECRQTLRKDSSSRKPLRHHHIYQFPSENIPKRLAKRKRLEVDEEDHLNSSKIMYFKKDTEEEVDMQEDNKLYMLFKKLKRFKTDNTTTQNSFNPCINNIIPEVYTSHANTENMFKHRSPTDQIHTTVVPNLTNNPPCSRQEMSTLQNISDFFTYVGSSIKELFKFR